MPSRGELNGVELEQGEAALRTRPIKYDFVYLSYNDRKEEFEGKVLVEMRSHTSLQR